MKKAQTSTKVIKVIINIILVVAFVVIPLLSFTSSLRKTKITEERYYSKFYSNIFNAMLSSQYSSKIVLPIDPELKMNVKNATVNVYNGANGDVYDYYFLTNQFPFIDYSVNNLGMSYFVVSKTPDSFLSYFGNINVLRFQMKKKFISLVFPDQEKFAKNFKKMFISNKVRVGGSSTSNNILINLSFTHDKKYSISFSSDTLSSAIANVLFSYFKTKGIILQKKSSNKPYIKLILPYDLMTTVEGEKKLLFILYHSFDVLFDFGLPHVYLTSRYISDCSDLSLQQSNGHGGFTNINEFECKTNQKLLLSPRFYGNYFIILPNYVWYFGDKVMDCKCETGSEKCVTYVRECDKAYGLKIFSANYKIPKITKTFEE